MHAGRFCFPYIGILTAVSLQAGTKWMQSEAARQRGRLPPTLDADSAHPFCRLKSRGWSWPHRSGFS